MKQRIVFNIAALVSLLLFSAATALWGRSYWRHDLRVTKRGFVQESIESVRGAVRFCRVTGGYVYPPEDEGAAWYVQPVFATSTLAGTYHLRSHEWLFAGGGVIEGDFREGFIYPGEPAMPYRVIVVPYWVVSFVCLILPFIWVMRFSRRRGRLVSGRCVGCGYDLRATPGRCPECGLAAGDRKV